MPAAVAPDATRLASSTITSSPARASTHAAIAPVNPPPMTTMSAVRAPRQIGYFGRLDTDVRSAQ